MSAACALSCLAQDRAAQVLTLGQVIDRARANSVEAEMALHQLRGSYWTYRSYRAELLPELTFAGTLPSYRKQFSAYMNDSGSYSFVPNDYLQLNGELSVTQNIWLTGGKISLSSSLDFYRQFGDNTFNRFMSLPVTLTLTQPIFGVNNIKWNRRIEPVRYEEACAEYMSATEDVAAKAIQYYFALIMAEENVDIARQNLENATRLYEVAKEKRKMGSISGNDLLQMELNLLDAGTDLTERESDLKNSMFMLRSFLDLDTETDISAEIPEGVPNIKVEFEDALDKALANNKFAKNQLRRQLEADYDVAKAKGEQRQINLYAQLGLTGTGNTPGAAYSDIRANRIIEIGFEIPLVDWGRRRGRVKVAESNRRLVESRLRQEQTDFRQNLFILVERYGNQRQLLEAARRADEIAQKRYNTNMETFIIGKISTLDLNDSRVKKDEARREYVNEMYLYWLYYYQIRSLTLWDYERNTKLTIPDEILKM